MRKVRTRTRTKVTKKEKPISWWIKKCDKAMSILVREKGHCEWCGSTQNLQHAHIIGRSNKTLRYDIINALCLCVGCHIYKWHRSPLEAFEWFQSQYPDRYTYLLATRNILTKNRTVEDYKKIFQDIESKNIRNLFFGKTA